MTTDTASVPSSTSSAPSRAAAPASVALLVVGFVLVSLNSRVAFGQIGPLAPVAGWSPWLVTLLGLLPPLCMGLGAPLGPLAHRRLGEERGILAASAVVLAGSVVRVLGEAGLIAGTVVVSLGIAVVNVLVPALVRRRFRRERTGLLFGIYAVAMGAGSATAVALTVPAFTAAGGSWPVALGIAVLPAALAAAAMLAPARRAEAPRAAAPRDDAAPGPAPAASPVSSRASSRAASRPHVARTLVGWSLLAFFGLTTLLFYATLAWLPSILTAAGLPVRAATSGQTALIVGVAIGGLIAPIVGGRLRGQRSTLAGLALVSVAGYLGLLLAPTAAPLVWSALLGAGLGAGQAIGGVLYARRGHDHVHTAALSAFAQTFGYLVAALGPVLLTVLATATGGWAAPLIACAAIAVAACVLGLPGASSRRDAAGPAHG